MREPLCALVEIYGEDSPEVAFLRYFRDTVLAETTEGKALIEHYYQLSPALVRAMREDEELKAQLRDLSSTLLQLME